MSAAVEDAARNAEMWGGSTAGTNGLGPAPTPSPAPASIPRPARYDLKGIRDRMKQRYVGHTQRAGLSPSGSGFGNFVELVESGEIFQDPTFLA
jgi:hypothetical protein